MDLGNTKRTDMIRRSLIVARATEVKNSWKKKKKKSHPLNSRKRQITLATISSLLSNGAGGGVLLPLVRLASRSVAVAPKHNAKSSVAD